MTVSQGTTLSADLPKLREHAYAIRQNALRMGEVQGQGYIGQALGSADILAAAYFHAMKYKPEDPEWEGRDRFLLSIGHYAIGLYAALIEAGVLNKDDIEDYGTDDSRLPMSGMAAYTPGMEITGGSLGHGLGIAVGVALGLKRKNSSAFVYNMLSDGELDEGSTWEAVLSGAHWKLDNLIALVDVNRQQADGNAQEVLATEPIHEKFKAFGWHVQRVNGNDLPAVAESFDRAKAHGGSQPRAIIFDTLMGKGVKFLEEREKNHFIRVDQNEWALALKQLER